MFRGQVGGEYLVFVLIFLILSSFFITLFKTNVCACQPAMCFVSTCCRGKMRLCSTEVRFVADSV